MFLAVSVCLWVCLYVNTITSERVNIGWWNLGGRCIAQKSQPSWNLGHSPHRDAQPPKMWRFAESSHKTQTKRCVPTKHRIGRIARIGPAFGYDVGKINAGCLVLTTVSNNEQWTWLVLSDIRMSVRTATFCPSRPWSMCSKQMMPPCTTSNEPQECTYFTVNSQRLHHIVLIPY